MQASSLGSIRDGLSSNSSRTTAGGGEKTLGKAPRLTRREAQVLKLTAKGLSSKQIASVFAVSHQAVDYHVRNLLSKFGCDNRTGMVARAFVLGYLDSGGLAAEVDQPRVSAPLLDGRWRRMGWDEEAVERLRRLTSTGGMLAL